MGTRSVTYTHFGDRSSDIICAVYRQMDGYPTEMGKDIKTILGGKTVVNGMSGDTKSVVNGMGCAAATLISSLKDGAGSIYMTKPDADGEEFNYHIFFTGDVYNPAPDAKLSISVEHGGGCLWSGLISDFDCESVEQSIE